MPLAHPRPPFDPELEAILSSAEAQLPPTLTAEMIPLLRQANPVEVPPEEVLAGTGIVRRDVTIPGFEGAEIEISVLQREGRTGRGPGIYYPHGGGMVIDDRWAGLSQFLPWVIENDAVAITVEYRLAPEFPDPYPVEDAYAGLLWTSEHGEELGIDPDRLIIAGASAGGGLAAGIALLARDRKGPALAGQVLIYPMLDDRDATVSTVQIDGEGIWDRGSNILGWSALLGERKGTDEVSTYAAPARATDLSGLPPAYIDCGSAEVFRDEDVAYATLLWQSGVQAELHVWPGGYHGFDMSAPDSVLGKKMISTRSQWIAQILKG